MTTHQHRLLDHDDEGPGGNEARKKAGTALRGLTDWIVFGAEDKEIAPEGVKRRAMVAAYAIAPDFFGGKRIVDISKHINCPIPVFYDLARDFTKRIGLPFEHLEAEREEEVRRAPRKRRTLRERALSPTGGASSADC